ncbi:hypothetical protein MKZ38_004663 [Zalerion maritima]|uniref:Uncharacterized protein n=1 Tax=Zalerion maritima TaxID=339359 RepID=A0AAD5RLW5_9PEZI|nr:hypothetical protein MKZ38_004663 [Zalerion maritima]
MSTSSSSQGVYELSHEATGLAVTAGNLLTRIKLPSSEGEGQSTIYPKEALEELIPKMRAVAEAAKLPRAKSSILESRITAAHFHKSTVLTVEQDEMIDIIPVHCKDGTEHKIGDDRVDLGWYFHTKKEIPVEPDFHAILIVSRLKPTG